MHTGEHTLTLGEVACNRTLAGIWREMRLSPHREHTWLLDLRSLFAKIPASEALDSTTAIFGGHLYPVQPGRHPGLASQTLRAEV